MRIRFTLSAASAFAAACCTFGQAATAPQPDLFKNPFNQHSAHHRPIGTGAIYAADDDPATVDWLALHTININSKNGFGDRITESTAADPSVTVTFKPTRRGTGGAGLPVTLRLPAGFCGGTTTDAAANVDDALRRQLQADLQKVYKFIRQVKNNAPNQTASGGGAPLARNSAFDAPASH